MDLCPLMVLGNNHHRRTGYDSVGLHLSSATATHAYKRVNKADYCVPFMRSSWLPPASNFAKNQENFKRELCLNVIVFLFPLLSVVLS